MARHSLVDWLKNASDDTLKSSGLGRKAAGVQNIATDTRKRSAGGKAKAQQPEHNMQVKLISEICKLALYALRSGLVRLDDIVLLRTPQIRRVMPQLIPQSRDGIDQ